MNRTGEETMASFVGTTEPHRDIGLSFERPSLWVDRSTIVYSAPRDPANPSSVTPNIVVARHALQGGEALQVHALREIMELAKRLRGFQLVESSDAELAGLPALRYRFTWQSAVGVLEQTFTIVETPNAVPRTSTTFLTTARKADARAANAFFQAILRTIRFETLHAPPISKSPSIPIPRGGEVR